MGVTRNFVVLTGEPHPLSVTQDRFYTVYRSLGTSLAVHSLELGDVCYSYINHSEFSWYIKQSLLSSRGLLLGASIKLMES